MDWMERAENEIEEDHANGNISDQEYNDQMRLLAPTGNP